ncbi:type II secretion system protein [Vibrio sp. 404]|uniref:Type II secretion system protein n=2 Tax=Vibrio marinisediminis TaxID=2758441 RepID=A0A7W2FP92_9VIBR|nr:type II secretion system protein [Vibrio marinisediminis]
MKSRKAINNSKGFSLLEMTIVIAIVGILASAALPNYFDVKDSAKEAVILNAWQSLLATNSSTLGEALLEGKDVGRNKVDDIFLWNGNIVMNAPNLRRALSTNLEVLDISLFNLPINEDDSIQHGLYVMHSEDYSTYKNSGVIPKCFIIAVQRKSDEGKPYIEANTELC